MKQDRINDYIDLGLGMVFCRTFQTYESTWLYSKQGPYVRTAHRRRFFEQKYSIKPQYTGCNSS
jgi:hypothetical protein